MDAYGQSPHDYPDDYPHLEPIGRLCQGGTLVWRCVKTAGHAGPCAAFPCDHAVRTMLERLPTRARHA